MPEQTDDREKDAPAQGQSDKDKKPRLLRKKPLIIGGIVVGVILVAGIIWWLMSAGEVTTDDAYTQGRAISIATDVSGYVTVLNVNDNQFVHKGDLLLVVDPRRDQANVAQADANLVLAQANLVAAQVNLDKEKVNAPAQKTEAEARVAEADAELADAKRNYARERTVDRRATAQSNIDQAAQQLISAKAKVKQAKADLAVASLVQQNIASAEQQVAQRKAAVTQATANLNAAKVQLAYNYIRAPQDGWITQRNVEQGSFLQAGSQVFQIVTPQVWIVANFKETQLTHMHPGQHVTISVDAYPSLKLRGHVQSIQKGSGAEFSAFPAENATGNFVKIVRRVPVKIVIDSGLPASRPVLPLGISVEPTVHEP